MENKPTHLKWRQAIKNHKKLLLTEVYNPGDTKLDEETYHAYRAELYERYEDGVSIFPLVKALKERKTFNEDYPLSVLIRIIDSKCGKRHEAGIVIAAMLMRGFKCDWSDDPLFNISSASRPLK